MFDFLGRYFAANLTDKTTLPDGADGNGFCESDRLFLYSALSTKNLTL